MSKNFGEGLGFTTFSRRHGVLDSVKDWWRGVLDTSYTQHKAIGSLIMLTSWSSWTESNAKVFHNEFASPSSTVMKINAKKIGVSGVETFTFECYCTGPGV